MKVLILGGGASGLMAALSAAQDERNTVTVLERQSRVGRKLLATGNGRCNLTNLDLSPVHYHGQDAGFARAALSRFDGKATLDFFHALGLLTTAEPSGRVYPLSDQSNSVVDVLRFAAAQAGVQLVCGFDAQSVKKKARGYQVTGADSSAYFGDKLIIACGGCAGLSAMTTSTIIIKMATQSWISPLWRAIPASGRTVRLRRSKSSAGKKAIWSACPPQINLRRNM